DQLRFGLKWPNDVLAGRQKLAGILLEAEALPNGLAVVVGIGTNVVAAPYGTPTPATSLNALGVQIGAEELFGALSDAWVEFGGLSGSGVMARPDELTFAPLGGGGEIGMYLSIYGLGNRHQRSWLAVDLGVSFGDEEHLPGIDLIMPDVRFLEKERNNLMGLV